MSGIDARSGVGGVHDTMVDIIRRHRYGFSDAIDSLSGSVTQVRRSSKCIHCACDRSLIANTQETDFASNEYSF